LVKKNREQHRRDSPAEGRASEALTVMWMMSVVTTVACGVVAALVRLAASAGPGNDSALLFSRLLHFGAFVTAIVSLVFLGVVLKVRSEPPPAAVTWFSVAVALAAIGAAFLY
jgi:hypothetical protein